MTNPAADLAAAAPATLPAGPQRIEACGVQGMKSKPWRRVFASQAAFERFLDSDAGQNVTIHATRDAD